MVPIYYPNGVHALLQRLNGNAPPTKTIGRKAPGTNGFVLACDAVPWKWSARREAERLEALRRQAEEEEEERKKKAKSRKRGLTTMPKQISYAHL